MLLATDVAYTESNGVTTARAAGVRFDDWSAEAPVDVIIEHVADVAPYVPGAFYQRELPCLWPVVLEARDRGRLEAVVVDGFVDLGAAGEDKPGLGRHLHRCLRSEGLDVAVVGVAKNPYCGADAVPVRRGDSEVPLWVSAAGWSNDEAAQAVRRMHGPYRFPTLLRRVDQLANDK